MAWTCQLLIYEANLFNIDVIDSTESVSDVKQPHDLTNL